MSLANVILPKKLIGIQSKMQLLYELNGLEYSIQIFQMS